MSLSFGERLILMMLADIQMALDVRGEIDPNLVKSAILSDADWGLQWTYSGIANEKIEEPAHVTETADVLTMWRMLDHAIEDCSEEDKKRLTEIWPRALKFPGFDGNSEPHYGAAVFMVETMGRFSERKDTDLNSHAPLVPAYRRMLEEYRPMMRASRARQGLMMEELVRIFEAARSV